MQRLIAYLEAEFQGASDLLTGVPASLCTARKYFVKCSYTGILFFRHNSIKNFNKFDHIREPPLFPHVLPLLPIEREVL